MLRVTDCKAICTELNNEIVKCYTIVVCAFYSACHVYRYSDV